MGTNILSNPNQKITFLKLFQSISIFFIFSLFSFIKSKATLKEGEDELELIFVYQHIRHGARGPSASYNSLFKDGVDEFRVSWEGEGDGELTLVGKREHYDMGVRNRHKYGKGKNGLGLIDFSTYNPEEVLFHVTDYNRTHQSLNSELIGMYQPGLLKTLTQQQVNGSYPPNDIQWFKRQNESLYADIIAEITSLENKTIVDNIPVFNVHPFGPNRTFNLETNCKNLDNMRLESLKGKDELLYGYFLKYKEELRLFFQLPDYSYFTNIRMMNSITDHYISDYKNYKDLSMFHNITGIDLDEFFEKSGKFYHDWMYNYYCTNITCSMESSRLMEDLLGYMKRRIQYYPETTYYAPKLVIDCGHDTTVAPMQMFMYEAWEHKPEYGVRTQYCGFACNIYFELYKTTSGRTRYFVYYYIDDELIHIFDYDEFDETIRAHMYTQENITEYCITDEEKEERERKKKEEEEERKKEEERKRKEAEGESFSENFNKNKLLWIGFFTFIFTTILGIVGIIVLIIKIHNIKHPKRQNTITVKEQELSSKLVTQSEANV
jgi:Ca2+/Na+ antiporter